MKASHLFTVPAGEKLTEKVFLRVLISSICSILLCMGCLFGTTWAWFTYEIDNPDNEIRIASVEFAEVELTRDGNAVSKNANTGAYDLSAGTYSVKLQVANDAKTPKRAVYVVMTLRMEKMAKSYYFPLNSGEGTVEQADFLELTGEGKATLSFALSWVIPASASTVPAETIQISAVEPPKQETETEKETEEKATEEEKPSTTPESAPSTEPTPPTEPTAPSGEDASAEKSTEPTPEASEPASTQTSPTEEPAA